ncbi:hypothetical protein AX16_007985 [Volvariella volvacea WC 439]|nr:hypothetical protein AX16_007985 [Volvariella volvacea WC 439]
MAAQLRRQPSDSPSPPSSPVLTPVDSTAALILVTDDDDADTPFDFSSDEDDDTLDQQYDVRRTPILPLSPADTFLFLLAPYLRLGALILRHSQLPLNYGLPPLFLFAGLAAFSRQILYMLSRHLKKTELEDVILDAFARGRGKEKQRAVLRTLVRASCGVVRVLLAATYLRESAVALLPFVSEDLGLPTQPVLVAILAIALTPFVTSKSLASPGVVYTAWFSVVAFVAWLSCVSYAYTQGNLEVNPDSIKLGAFWQGISVTAFAFCSSSTLPLYTALRGSALPITTTRHSKSRSFKIVSPLTVAIAFLMILPLVFFSAHSIVPEMGYPSTGDQIPSVPQPVPEEPHDHHLPAIHAFRCLVLLSSVPSVLAIIPPLPIPRRVRDSINFSLSKVILFAIVLLLALAPHEISTRCNDVLLLMSLAGTYFLPAVLHVTIHFFKRPLTIVIPQTPATPPTPIPRSTPASPSPHVGDGLTRSPRSRGPDELLQRKERALQRKQLRKRIVWDIGVWLLLIVSVSGFGWGAGRLAQKW